MEGTLNTYSSRQLFGSEVVELLSGAVLGTVFDTLIDLDKGEAKFLGILPASWYQGGTVLSVEDIIGFDEGVLLIEKAGNLTHLQSKDAKHKDRLMGVRDLVNRTVIDKSGAVYGKVLGVIFSRKGKITGLEVEKEILERTISVAKIVAIGEKYIIVDLEKEAGGGAEEDKSKEVERGGEMEAKGKKAKALKVAVPHESPSAVVSARRSASARGKAEMELSDLMGIGQVKGRRLENLVDKPSPVSFFNEHGEPIVSAGERLTPNVLNKLLGEGLLQELFTALPEHQNNEG